MSTGSLFHEGRTYVPKGPESHLGRLVGHLEGVSQGRGGIKGNVYIAIFTLFSDLEQNPQDLRGRPLVCISGECVLHQ